MGIGKNKTIMFLNTLERYSRRREVTHMDILVSSSQVSSRPAYSFEPQPAAVLSSQMTCLLRLPVPFVSDEGRVGVYQTDITVGVLLMLGRVFALVPLLMSPKG